MSTLGDVFAIEQKRCRDLLTIYQSIGAPGVFGAVVISDALARAENAMASGDVVEIVRSYQELRELE